jgi:hypothetical protein
MGTQLGSLTEELEVIKKIKEKALDHGDFDKALEYNEMERKVLLQVLSLQ